MDGRLSKIESDVNHIQSDMGDLKADARRLLWWGILAVAITWGGVLYVAEKMYDKFDGIGTAISGLSVQLERTSSNVNKIGLQIENSVLSNENSLMMHINKDHRAAE